jgi:ABC-type sugar transport system permease subunit
MTMDERLLTARLKQKKNRLAAGTTAAAAIVSLALIVAQDERRPLYIVALAFIPWVISWTVLTVTWNRYVDRLERRR